MPVTCKEKGRSLMAQVAGELDHHGAKAVMEELDRYIDEILPRELILDLGGLTFTDSSGIAVLLRALRQMERSGGSLRVTGVPAQARRVLDAAGIGRLISLD